MRTNEQSPIGTGWDQQELWYDSMEDALRAVVDALGGPKRVASALWPAKTLADGRRQLLHSLDPARREKLDLAELDHLGRLAREAGCHVLMAYLAKSWDYEMPQTVDPEDEEERLRRAFMQSVKAQEQIARRLERLDHSRRERDLRRVG